MFISMNYITEKISFNVPQNGGDQYRLYECVDQMSLDFNWEEIDDELIQREATISVANGEYDDWDHAYESHWNMWESGDLILTESF